MLSQALREGLASNTFPEDGTVTNRYQLTQFHHREDFIKFIAQEKHRVDCLILEGFAGLGSLLRQLRDHTIFLPIVVLTTGSLEPSADLTASEATILQADLPTAYHSAVLRLPVNQLGSLPDVIDLAISKFLRISPPVPAPDPNSSPALVTSLNLHSSLMQQQQRLSEKLKARLGYLGVYYKRNPANFLRYMSPADRQKFLKQLKNDYRNIILNYFLDDVNLNEQLDQFVNLAFFADVPVAQVVEIHMDLMDEFTKQLKLEGRSEEILLDYRLTLIDAIAHLCEMYRRSIPRES